MPHPHRSGSARRRRHPLRGIEPLEARLVLSALIGEASPGAGGGAVLRADAPAIETRTILDSAYAAYSDAPQSAVIRATITDSTGKLYGQMGGTVTFTVRDGSTVIGAPVAGTVHNGGVSVAYPLPAGLAVGRYTISAAFSGTDPGPSWASTPSVADDSELVVGERQAIVFARDVFYAAYDPAAQSIAVTAGVRSTGSVVQGGTVSFQIADGPKLFGSPATAEVVDGTATATLTIPAGLAARSYPIYIAYSGTPDLVFTPSRAVGNLVVQRAEVTMALDPIEPISPIAAVSTRRVRAVVSGPSGAVNEGYVTFYSGLSTQFRDVIVPVRDGVATADIDIPPPFQPGVEIQARYESSANYKTGYASRIVDVLRPVVDIALDDVTATISRDSGAVTITATVTSESGIVDHGEVIISVSDADGRMPWRSIGRFSQGRMVATYNVLIDSVPGAKTIHVEFPETSLLTPGRIRPGTLTTINPDFVRDETTIAVPAASSAYNPGGPGIPLLAYVGAVRGVSVEEVTFLLIRDGVAVAPAFKVPIVSGIAQATMPWPEGLGAGSYTVGAYFPGTGRFAPSYGEGMLTVVKGPASFQDLSPSQAIDRRRATVDVSGRLPGAAGGRVGVAIGSATGQATVRPDGTFSATIDVRGLPATSNPLPITYRFAGDANLFAAADASKTLAIRRGTQALSLGGVPAASAFGSTFRVRPASDAGLPVTLAATNALVVPIGDGSYDVTPTSGTAPVVLTATQAGDAGYEAAIPASATVATAPAAASILLSRLEFEVGTPDRTPIVETTPPGLAVALSYTRDGVPVADPVEVGIYTVTATIVDPNYIGTASATLAITPRSIVVDPFPQPPPAPPEPPAAAAQAARLVTNRKKAITSLAVSFGEDLDPASAVDVANYRLATAGRKGSFDARNARTYRIRRVAYDAATRTVTLELARPLKLAGVAQLRVYGAQGRGLRDVLGRLIDGNRDGLAGGDLNLTVRRKGIAF
ncbi:MBG domain-containing protein [Tundrisphaera sp. TA3]|uniref:MBG domain-containing protein n=1 Tax=Tundrisphaera sp. TA3 TaxID=3435775 RepID=UPI003EB99C38